MPENILIAIAWPYSNAEIHVGNITGSHLPGDIVARYHRLTGNNVLMVSGTDSHGRPVTIAADREGRPVEEVYKKYHNGFLELFEGYGITYDLFTTTHTENHFKVHAGHLPGIEGKRFRVYGQVHAVVLPLHEALPARSLRGRDLLHLTEFT